jgi:hypothetical protein
MMMTMDNVIDMFTRKPIEVDGNAETPVGDPSLKTAAEEQLRRLNLVRRQIYEAIGSCLSEIDGKNYTFLD